MKTKQQVRQARAKNISAVYGIRCICDDDGELTLINANGEVGRPNIIVNANEDGWDIRTLTTARAGSIRMFGLVNSDNYAIAVRFNNRFIYKLPGYAQLAMYVLDEWSKYTGIAVDPSSIKMHEEYAYIEVPTAYLIEYVECVQTSDTRFIVLTRGNPIAIGRYFYDDNGHRHAEITNNITLSSMLDSRIEVTPMTNMMKETYAGMAMSVFWDQNQLGTNVLKSVRQVLNFDSYSGDWSTDCEPLPEVITDSYADFESDVRIVARNRTIYAMYAPNHGLTKRYAVVSASTRTCGASYDVVAAVRGDWLVVAHQALPHNITDGFGPRGHTMSYKEQAMALVEVLNKHA